MRAQVVAALLVAVTACGCSGGDEHPSPARRTTGQPTGQSSTQMTDADNRRAAEREAARVLDLVQLPPGSLQSKGKVPGWPDSGMSLGPSDSSLTQTRWFTVPTAPEEVEAYLLAHPSAAMHAADGVGGIGDSDGIRYLDFTNVRPTESAAFAGPNLLVQWRALSGTTAVRIDSFVAARHARTDDSLVKPPVSRVVLDQVPATGWNGKHLPHRRHVVVTDPARIARLVAVANRLYGSLIAPGARFCPFMPATQHSVRFEDAGGTIQFAWTSGCGSQVQVIRNGQSVAPTLDPGGRDGIDAVFRALLR